MYLLWGPMYIHEAYFGLFGAPRLLNGGVSGPSGVTAAQSTSACQPGGLQPAADERAQAASGSGSMVVEACL